MNLRPYLLATAALLLTTLVSVAAFRAVQTPAPSTSMASMLPQGALLTIESPDFAALLHQWNVSPEQKTWLTSDDYSVFSNSRLFGRLNDARAEFEAAAKPRPNSPAALNADFLTQVAGRQSIFAWYDIGNLEFLYITHLNAAQAAKIALLKDRASWTPRQSGGVTFYLRKSPTAGPAAQAEDAAQSAQGKARTVAFAQVDGLLLLATREDLIANALELLHPASTSQITSLAQEPWFIEVTAALPASTSAPALHMVLNLSRLVPLPYFRSYWVQQNITQMKQYRAAVDDFTIVPAVSGVGKQFRDDRVLLLNSTAPSGEAYLNTLTALAPPAGVYRAIATQNPADAVSAIAEKLLGRITPSDTPGVSAPDPSLDVAEAGQSGASADLETRIDTPAPVTAIASDKPLTDALNAVGLESLLTWSGAEQSSPPPPNSTQTNPAAPARLWIPIHSAVVLQSSSPLNPKTLQSALQQSLRGSLSTASLGIEFRAETVTGLQGTRDSRQSGITARLPVLPAQTIYVLTGPKPLFFYTVDTSSPSTTPNPVHLCILTDDRATLLDMINEAAALPQTRSLEAPYLQIQTAAFDHASQRAPYARLTSLIDGTNQSSAQPSETPPQPTFFSGNIRSLSDTFAALVSQHFTERRDGPILRQTVTYRWQTP